MRKIQKKVVLILTALTLLPLVILGGGIYSYMARTLKQKTMEAIQKEAVSHKNTIDAFLTERTMDLKYISENNRLYDLVSPGALEQVLFSLRHPMPYFQDLGILGPQGVHLAYTGPVDPGTLNFREMLWFKAVMEQGIYISDVFMDSKNQPQFIIAVKRSEEKSQWIIKATILSGLFDNIVTQGLGNRKGDAFLVNSQGVFQTTPRKGNKPMTQSPIKPPGPFRGVQVEELDSTLTLTTWLGTLPWLSVVTMDKKDLFEDSGTLGKPAFFLILLGGFILVPAILLAANRLTPMLENREKNPCPMDARIIRTAFLASSMNLTPGVLGDLNDILSNIHVTARLVKDQADPENTPDIHTMAEQITLEAIRGRNLINRFIRFTSSEYPWAKGMNVHTILNQVLGFLETSLTEKNILTMTDFPRGLPSVHIQAPVLRQIFLTLLLNSATAAGADCLISLSTSVAKERIRILISDDGPGLGKADLEQIFDPWHVTGRGDWGLGLAITQEILKNHHGTLRVRNRKEQGVTFEVQLPLNTPC